MESQEKQVEPKKGLWLWTGLLVAGLVKTPSAWQMASIMMTARPSDPMSFWCQRPEEQVHYGPEEWINMTHPWDADKGSWDKCNIWTNASMEPCLRWEWQRKDTIIEEWTLVCGWEVLVPFQQLGYLFGVVFGGVLSFFLIQRFGPRLVLISGMVAQIIFGSLVSFVSTYTASTLFRFLTALACTHMFTSGMQLCSKVLGPRGSRWAIIVPACYEMFWSLGTLSLALFGYFISDWRLLQLSISLPTTILFAFSWLIPNLPDPPQESITSKKEKEPKKAVPSKCVQIIRIIGLHIALACTVVNYYGGLLNSNNWGPYLFLNISLAGVSEILGVLLAIAFMLVGNLKWLALIVVLLVGGLPMTFCNYLPDPNHPDMIFFGIVGRIAASCALTQFTVQGGEFFPDANVEKWTIFSGTLFARICLLSAPFINYFIMVNKFNPMMLYGCLLILGSLALGVIASTTRVSRQIKPI